MVNLHRLADDVANRHAGVERRVGVLEDHLHLAPHLAQLLALQLAQVLAIEEHLAAGGAIELQDGAAGGRLAAARFADQAQGLAALDRKVQPVNGAYGAHLTLDDDAFRDREVHLQIP